MRARLGVRAWLVVVGTGLCIATGLTVIWSRAHQAARPGLTVLVNHRPRIEILPGTPLVFQLSLGSSASSESFRVGSRLRPWHTLLRLEGTDRSGGRLSWPMSRVGSPRSIHVIREPNGRPRMNEEASSVARLEAGRRVHTVILAAGPDATAAIAPGTYRFRAVLETPYWLFWGWSGRAVSSAITIVVRDPAQAGTKAEELETTRLALTVAFYLNEGRSADAHRVATSLTSLRPKDSRSYVLLGDALAGMRRQQDALRAYRTAMALLPPLHEEPTLLLDRISQLVDGAGR